MEPFTKRVVEIIKGIPEGKVMTYGQIATLAGSPRGARQVVRVLHSLSKKYNLPWHRVINSKGEISIVDYESRNLQKVLLENEGVKFNDGGTINLKEFQSHGHNSFMEYGF
ncbi:MGMT family protein [Clostridium bowmanii]|uniref:MGMT family protein n=1 Tax=Clostridium bowmanii TaxID=132925 RepID=UPI001C0E6EB5|nr:MGMT family protein [Clostridium bowmanii]MBU3191959.1 MGMT family protein [Clostridium bowmanii]MCA1076228.1 MGMT family protein [Clostridium bowmanii]